MKLRSLTGRVIVTVICVEALLALCITVLAIDYQRRESIRSFDIMLHGRADSVLGAVQDAEDIGDNVMLDKSSINVPPGDVYAVSEENGHFIGSSGTNASQLQAQMSGDASIQRVRLGPMHYRAIAQHSVRLIDPDEPGTGVNGKGTLHHVVILYASPTQPIHDAFWHTVHFFAVADALALLLSAGAVTLLIRHGLRPLGELATQASRVTPHSWEFKSPASAYQLEELRPLAAALDNALQGLEQAFRQQRSFVNDAAHELKTAVTLLKSSLQLLNLRDRTRSEYQAGIEGCLADCGRMEELVQRMLLLARVEQYSLSPGTPQKETCMANTLRQVTAQLESAAGLRRIALKTAISDERCVLLPEEDSATLLTNLLVNAIQHSHADSTILARLQPLDSSSLELAIIDHGHGISSEHLPRLFERFYRADDSRSRETGGTGLGLAICKAIVEAHQGTIKVESRLGEGTTVTVVLPAQIARREPTLAGSFAVN